MDFLEIIKTRRSIRSFEKKEIPENLLNEIIEAGDKAPSSKNSKPWHFVVLKGKEKDIIIKKLEKKFNENQEPKWISFSTTSASFDIIKKSGAWILFFNKAPFSGGRKKLQEKFDNNTFSGWNAETQSISASVENMLLATHALGLGGVWINDVLLFKNEIEEELKINYDLTATIAIGYPKK